MSDIICAVCTFMQLGIKLLIIKPPAQIRTNRGLLRARQIVVSGQKLFFLISGPEENLSRAKDLGERPPFGEIFHLISRFNRDRPDQHFSTLDTLLRQSLEISSSNTNRWRLLNADAEVAANIASTILPEWHAMSRDQLEAIRAVLSELAERLQKARNPNLVSAAGRVKGARDLRDRTGRPNPLITETRLLAALRDFDAETIQSEIVRLSSNDRVSCAIELGREINQNIKQLLAALDDPATSREKIERLLADVAVKPYYFAVRFGKTLFGDNGLTEVDRVQLKKAFDYEANLIMVSDVLSLLAADLESYNRIKPTFGAFALPQALSRTVYDRLHAELTRALINLDAAMRMRQNATAAEQSYIEESIGKQIRSFKDQVRYRSW